MEPKKKPAADLEKNRFAFFQTGLIVSLLFVFAAFEWRMTYNPAFDTVCRFELIEDDIILIPPVNIPVAPPAPKPPVIDVITVTEDDIPESDIEIPDNYDFHDDNDLPSPDWNAPDEDDSDLEPVPFEAIEEKPEFPGGQDALMNYLRNNLRVPVKHKKSGLDETVYVRFIINTDGSVTVSDIIGGNKELKEEAARVVKNMPAWKPGKQRTKPVSVYFSLPVRFKVY
jgi:periplasmic protein TonB